MPEPAQPLPNEPPEPTPHSRQAEIIREARGFGRWMASLTPAQFQAFALSFMTMFVCSLGGWVVYQSEISRSKDKDREVIAREVMTRECNTQAELGRQHYSLERERDRTANAALLKELQAAFVQYLERESAKVREHDLKRDAEYLKTAKDIQNAWAAFAIKIADLERFLRGKKPAECDDECTVAPEPHLKVIEP